MSAVEPAPQADGPLQSPEQLLEVVKVEAHHLAIAVKNAEAGGVPPALLLPALAGVLREAGMMPEGFDLGALLGQLG